MTKPAEKSSKGSRKQQIDLTDKGNTYNTTNQQNQGRITNRDFGLTLQLGYPTSGRGFESARGNVKNCTSTKAGQARYDFTHMMTSENAPSNQGSVHEQFKQSSHNLKESDSDEICDESDDDNTSEQIAPVSPKIHDRTDQREWRILLDQADKSALIQ